MKKIFKAVFQSRIMVDLSVTMLYGLFWFLRFFYRFQWNSDIDDLISEKRSVIIAFWHQHLLVMIFFLFLIPEYRRNITVLISPSKDGEWAALFLDKLKVRTIRASTYKNPVKGGIQLMRCLRQKENSLALAVDGPRGPRHSVQPGVFTLAARSGKPIIPVFIRVSRKKCFSSWDRCIFPLPFARITLEGKEAMCLKDSFDLDKQKDILLERLGEE